MPSQTASLAEQFNETALFVRVLWSRSRGCYQVIGIDGRVLFESSDCRRAVHTAEGFEGDYADAVSS